MPSVRFSRDKRGYEYVYLVHTPTRRGKPGRSRVLYWYRTPPGVRVGRQPFDVDLQRALERQNPGVAFDWEAIVGTPMPPPDMTEFWRERRRAEKIARQERKAMEADEAGEASGAVASGTVEGESDAGPTLSPEETAAWAAPATGDSPATTLPVEGAASAVAGPDADAQLRKRRRRRGGRRGPAPAAEGRGERVVDSAPGGE